jgi:hypothetical protein
MFKSGDVRAIAACRKRARLPRGRKYKALHDKDPKQLRAAAMRHTKVFLAHVEKFFGNTVRTA